MTSLVVGYVKKKVVRSRDLVFEYQTIEDFAQKDKIVSTNFISSNADQIPFSQLPLMSFDHRGDL